MSMVAQNENCHPIFSADVISHQIHTQYNIKLNYINISIFFFFLRLAGCNTVVICLPTELASYSSHILSWKSRNKRSVLQKPNFVQDEGRYKSLLTSFIYIHLKFVCRFATAASAPTVSNRPTNVFPKLCIFKF